MPTFPIPAPAFDGRNRTVGIGAIFIWLRFGWNVFMVNPGMWIASALILIAGFGFLVLVPVLAGTAYAFYQDVFVAH